MIDKRIIDALALVSKPPLSMDDTGHDVGLIANELENRLSEAESLLRSAIDDPGWPSSMPSITRDAIADIGERLQAAGQTAINVGEHTRPSGSKLRHWGNTLMKAIGR